MRLVAVVITVIAVVAALAGVVPFLSRPRAVHLRAPFSRGVGSFVVVVGTTFSVVSIGFRTGKPHFYVFLGLTFLSTLSKCVFERLSAPNDVISAEFHVTATEAARDERTRITEAYIGVTGST